MTLQSNVYQAQANIQYGYAQRALRNGDKAASRRYEKLGDEYQELARIHRAQEAAAATPTAAAQRAATRALPGPTATAYLGPATDVQTVNNSIATQSAVADATRAVNAAQVPDPGAAGTISSLALQTQAQDYIDAPVTLPVAGPSPTYQSVMGATGGATAAATAASASAGPGPQLQDVIDAQSGGGNGLPAYADESRAQPPVAVLRPQLKVGPSPWLIGLGIVGVAVVARAVMR